MKELDRRAFGGLTKMTVFLTALIFLPAWTVHYWQGWMCLLVFLVCATGITLYLMKNDPALLGRRMSAGAGAEQEKSQKIIQVLSSIAFAGLFVVSALDHRFAWSPVPVPGVIGGELLIVLGFIFVFLVFKENSFTSGIIEVAADQKVISTGPYGVVRHPMYLGALIMLIGIPMALGSWWGEIVIVPMIVMLAWRLLDEERFLVQNLPGYDEYRHRVKY